MKIGVFTDSFKPYTSGVVTSICTFREELSALGHETFVFAPSYPNYRETDKNVFRFFSVPAPTNPDYSVPVPISPRINIIARKLDLDLIHVHTPFIMGQVGARQARRLDVPLVFTYHTQYDQYVHYVPMGQEWAKDLTIKYCRYFCNRCDLVITPSSDIKEQVLSYRIEAPVEVIPTGVDVNKFSRGDRTWLRREFGIDEDKKICIYVGRLTREKNLEFLLKAFRLVLDRYPKTCLVIVASGPLERELKKLTISQGMALNRDVIFTGFLPFERLVDAYHGADLFTFASLTETQGIVLVEAMASGLPVVAVRASGTQDMVENGRQGLLTRCDLEDFAQQVVRVLTDDELRRNLAEKAVKRAAALSSRAMAKKLEESYYRVIERYRGSQRRKFGLSWYLG